MYLLILSLISTDFMKFSWCNDYVIIFSVIRNDHENLGGRLPGVVDQLGILLVGGKLTIKYVEVYGATVLAQIGIKCHGGFGMP